MLLRQWAGWIVMRNEQSMVAQIERLELERLVLSSGYWCFEEVVSISAVGFWDRAWEWLDLLYRVSIQRVAAGCPMNKFRGSFNGPMWGIGFVSFLLCVWVVWFMLLLGLVLKFCGHWFLEFFEWLLFFLCSVWLLLAPLLQVNVMVKIHVMLAVAAIIVWTVILEAGLVVCWRPNAVCLVLSANLPLIILLQCRGSRRR